jgi:hypothetical protein
MRQASTSSALTKLSNVLTDVAELLDNNPPLCLSAGSVFDDIMPDLSKRTTS